MAEKISIVVLNWNGIDYLKVMIPKILEIEYPNKEIIVVDNGSIDGSREFVSSFKEIILLSNGRNLGYSQGKNIGVKAAQGRYVFLLDNDIFITDQKILFKLVRHYKSLPGTAFICPVLLEENRKKTYLYKGAIGYLGIKRVRPVKNEIFQSAKEGVYKSQFILGGNIFFEKKIWNHLGGLDEALPFNLDDYDISIRAYIFGFSNYFVINQPLNLHLRPVNSVNNKELFFRLKYLLAGQLLCILKNFNFLDIFLMSFFTFLRVFAFTIKEAILRRSFLVFLSVFVSFGIYAKNFFVTLPKRKIIQLKRTRSDRSLFKIETPKSFLDFTK